VDYGGAELAAALDGGGDGPAAPEPLNIDSLGDLGSQMVTMQINGEAVTLSVAEALKGSQRMKAATQKEMQAAASVKAAKAEIDALLADPAAYATRGGAESVDQIIATLTGSRDPAIQDAVERSFQKLMAESQMSPEQRASRDREAALADREARAKEFEDARASEARTVEMDRAKAQYHADFTAALKAKGMAATPHAIARAAMAMHAAGANGVEMDAAEAVSVAFDERTAERAAEFKGLEGQALLDHLGPEVARAVSAALIAQVRGAQAQPVTRAVPRASNGATEDAKSTDQLRSEFGLRRSVF